MPGMELIFSSYIHEGDGGNVETFGMYYYAR